MRRSKVCRTCGLEKIAECFYLSGRYLQPNCKECHKKIARLWHRNAYKNDPAYRERHKARCAKYSREHPEVRRRYQTRRWHTDAAYRASRRVRQLRRWHEYGKEKRRLQRAAAWVVTP